LQSIVDTLIVDFFELKEKVLSKKMGKGVTITCMKEVLVHGEYSMEVTHHRDPISYGKVIY
jgi:hypothetical protein